jgi:hypothetical protein
VILQVGHMAPRGCWDENIVTQLLDSNLYPLPFEVRHHDGYPRLDNEGAIMVIPGRYWHSLQAQEEMTKALSVYPWVLGFRTGDEEDLFDVRNIAHPNIKWWVQTPRADKFHDCGDRWFGVGWPPHFNNPPFEPGKQVDLQKLTDVFLSAQNTHARRNLCFKALETIARELKYKNIRMDVEPTPGFTQGMAPNEYAQKMTDAKLAPCPSGAISPDSFRLWEALQAHTVPIADNQSPVASYYASEYWSKMFGDDHPLSTIDTYAQLPGYIEDLLEAWPANSNRITAWWMRYKRQLTLDLVSDLAELGAL